MPANDTMIDNFADSLVGDDLFDKINSDEVQAKIKNLSELEQKGLAEKVVIQWTSKDSDISGLLQLKRHGRESSSIFFSHLLHAVDVLAPLHAFCDANNLEPQDQIKEFSGDDFLDNLNDMTELKSHLFKLVQPKLDASIAKIADKAQRNQLAKAFRSEKMMHDYINQANLVVDLVHDLKSEEPWQMFVNSEYNYQLLADHSAMVNDMISLKEASAIGQQLQDMPKKVRHTVSSELHTLTEAFRRFGEEGARAYSVFEIINQRQDPALVRPESEDLKNMAQRLNQHSMFEPAQEIADKNQAEASIRL